VGDAREHAERPDVTASFCPPPAHLSDVVEVLWVGRWDMPEGGEHVTELLGDPRLVHLHAFRRYARGRAFCGPETTHTFSVCMSAACVHQTHE
jgi:hypothetical protein